MNLGQILMQTGMSCAVLLKIPLQFNAAIQIQKSIGGSVFTSYTSIIQDKTKIITNVIQKEVFILT